MLALRPARLAGLSLVLAGLAGSGLVAATGPAGPPRAPDRAAAAVLAAAREQIGDTYEWAGVGPDVWDCSGLTSVLWRTAGEVATIPRTSRQQQAWATPIRPEDALPGDLVFFGEPVSHVSLYIGDGRIIDASSSRKSVVERAVWTSDLVRYGRVPRRTAPASRPVEPTPARSGSPTAAASATAGSSAASSGASPSASSPSVTPSPRSTPSPGRVTASGSARPSTSSAPRTVHAASATPSARPSATPSAGPPRPVPAPGHRPSAQPGKTAATFAAAAQEAVGAAYQDGRSGPTYDAAGLVRMAWWRATANVLPADLTALERRTKPIALAGLTIGDLVFYGMPAVHVGIYVGNGEMVDASKVLKKVSRRRVFSSETVRFARITG